MDNVTHSLIGIAAAECVATSPKLRPRDRVPLWIASAIANNLPDLDVFFTMGRHRDKLDYLLHHRGYTHTFLLAPLQALLLLAILRIVFRKRTDLPWRSLTALCLIGPFLHVFADSWNSYGVHPFWPLDNRWYYGDLTFIVEPWLWVAFLPLIWKRAKSIYGKGVALFFLAALLYLSWTHEYVTRPVAVAVTIGSAVWLLAQTRIRNDRIRIGGALAAIALFLIGMSAANSNVKTPLVAPGREIAGTSHPGNPFCWTVITAGFEGDTYRASAYTAAPWPSLVPAQACVNLFRGNDSVQKSSEEATAARIPLGEFRGTKEEYNKIIQSCRVRAFLRFARIPFWQVQGENSFVSDLRFGGRRSLNFAELSSSGEEPCPRFEPPWIGRFYPEQY